MNAAIGCRVNEAGSTPDRLERFCQAKSYWARVDSADATMHRPGKSDILAERLGKSFSPPTPPTVSLAAEPTLATLEAVEQLKHEMGDAPCICILGAIAFRGSDSQLEEIASAIATELAACFSDRVWFVTGGMSGVQKTFAKHCDGSRLWNLLPVGQASGYERGRDVHAGLNLEERKQVFGRLGDVYVVIEGGPGISQEVQAVASRGAGIVPVMRTGGASSGMFGFPSEALRKPECVGAADWALLGSREDSVSACARAVAAVVASLLESRGKLRATGRPVAENVRPGATAAAGGLEGARAAVAADRLRHEMGAGTLICILGGTALQSGDSEELVRELAGELPVLLSSACLVTCGMPGVQKVFARHCSDTAKLWNVLPLGQANTYGVGRDVHAGSSLEEARAIFGLLGDVYITVEGGPSIAQEARNAAQRGAAIVPLVRTG
mmetsp:Transcript_15129/g.44192  ORF Transcript_15129/g.44192 Transcript_15129/m.44192 type:complete len:440 (-) Transcript_15129:6-1325(-)